MVMYALAATPLISQLHSTHPAVSQVWYVNDATHVLLYGSGGIHFLRLDPCLDTIPMPLKHTLLLKINMLQLLSVLLLVPLFLSLPMGRDIKV